MKIIVAALTALSLGACATVTRGISEQITFTSEPDAEVRLSTGHSCPTTPCTLEINRKTEFVATFTRAGFEPQQIPVATRIAGAGAAGFVGNVIVGGVVGMGVDAATGSTLEHYPNPVHATLVPIALPKAQRHKPRPPRAVPVPVSALERTVPPQG